MSVDNFVPFECPVCLTLMRDFKDSFSFFSSGCCYECREEYLRHKNVKKIEDTDISLETKESLSKKRKEVPSYILR